MNTDIICVWSKDINNHPMQINTGECVFCLACSPDGKLVASGGAPNCTIQFWNPSTGLKVGESLMGHQKTILSIAYSECGLYLVSGSSDMKIKVWDIIQQKQVGKDLIGHYKAVTAVAFWKNKHRIVSGSIDASLRIWDIRMRNVKFISFHLKDQIQTLVLGIDVVICGDKRGRIISINSKCKKLIRTGQCHKGMLFSLSISCDMKMIISGGHDRMIRTWDLMSSKQLGADLIGHTHDVESVIMSQDQSQILSGSSDRSIRIWNAIDGQKIVKLSLGPKNILAVKYSIDGRYIIAGSLDKKIYIQMNNFK